MANELTEKTRIPLSLVVSMVVAAGMVVLMYAQIIAELKALQVAVGDTYKLSAASEVASRNALHNPTMIVVDPRDPDKVMPNEAGKAYARGWSGSTPR